MKKYSLFFLLIIVNFAFINHINAYSCTYEVAVKPDTSFQSEQNIEVTLEIDAGSKTISPHKFIGIEIGDTFLDEHISPNWTEEKLVEVMNGGCFSEIYLCQLTQITTPGGSKFIISSAIINPQLYNYLNNLTTSGGYRIVNMNNMAFGFKENDDCSIAKINNSKSTGKIVEQKIPCDAYDNLWAGLSKNYCQLNKDEGCSVKQIQDYKSAKEKIINYCNSILSYGDYINPCVFSCLSLTDEITKLENISADNGECGLSERLLDWLANILKWIKYILPVFVIILSILDFIKAIGADKDDEMKKAQKRFTTRLIAAALVFIIPLILEFILNKMGFGYNSCGLF